MFEIMRMLVGADLAMAAVAVVLVILTVAAVQGVKRLLPSPAPADPTRPENKWAIVEWLSWLPYVLAFVFGIILSVIFDPEKGQMFNGKLRDGLQTGACAVAVWEGYSVVLKPIIEKFQK